MDFKIAIETLELSRSFDLAALKRQYYKQALKYHPDKNKASDAEERFRAVNASYIYLQKYLKVEVEDINLNYLSIIKKCVRSIFPDIQWAELFLDSTIVGILKNCKKASLKIFDKISKEKALEVYCCFATHGEIFGLTDEMLKEMYDILQKKLNRDNIVILNPTIDDLLDDKVYKLEIEERIFTCPLWHPELCFDVSGADLIVQSLPDLEQHVIIDDNNDIICKFEGKIQRVLDTGKIVLKLGTHFFNIPADKIFIVKNQTYVFRHSGILRINEEDIYSTLERSHIYVEIKLY